MLPGASGTGAIPLEGDRWHEYTAGLEHSGLLADGVTGGRADVRCRRVSLLPFARPFAPLLQPCAPFGAIARKSGNAY